MELPTNATTGYEALSFMDEYSGHNQIKTHLNVEEVPQSSHIMGYFVTKSCRST